MFGIEQLSNTGIQFVGDESSLKKENKTLIVVGIARGGTSLIEGTLHHLGVFCGDGSRPPVFEDVRLADAFEKNDIDEANKIINEYNDRYNVWSFKRPAAIDYIQKLHTMCQNPIYLFIFKDIFAVSNRNSISMKTDLLSGLKGAYNGYGKVIKFISDNDFNGFFFSYEKIMANKEPFVDVLIDIIGKDRVTSEEKDSALNFIEPNPKDYLNASRITRGKGRVDSIAQTEVKGWAKYIHSIEPATVELYINEKFITTTVAKNFRQDLIDNKVHPTGHSAYHFDLTSTPLNNGDKVSVKIEDDVVFLKNSNQLFNDRKV